MRRDRRIVICLAASLVWAIAALPASAQSGAPGRAFKNFEAGIGDLAQGIAEELAQLAGTENKRIALAPFDGPTGANFPRLGQSLKRHLEKAKLTVDPLADWKISGEYFIDKADDQTGVIPIGIKAQIKDSNNVSRGVLQKEMFTDGTTGLTALLGLSNDLPVQAAGALGDLRLEELERSIRNRRTALFVAAGSQVKNSASSPCAIEILLVQNTGDPRNPQKFVPLPARDDPGGFTFVDIPPDSLYAIRLYNGSGQDVGATLSIDGVNIFSFSENPGWRKLGKVVIPAGKNGQPGVGLILGWHRADNESYHFQTKNIGDGAAAILGRPVEGVGTITVTFCGAYEKGRIPPEQLALAGGDKGDIATGLGPVVSQKYQPIERAFGVPQQSISLRYTLPGAPSF